MFELTPEDILEVAIKAPDGLQTYQSAAVVGFNAGGSDDEGITLFDRCFAVIRVIKKSKPSLAHTNKTYENSGTHLETFERHLVRT